MPTLVLLRHGQSVWNRRMRLTGWADIELTAQGRSEAGRAGAILNRYGYTFDTCFTSVLRRAVDTAEIVLAAMGQPSVRVCRSWRLNERHYGAFEGQSVHQLLGSFKFYQAWRCQREFSVCPPPLAPDDTRNPRRDPCYAGISAQYLPGAESNRDALERLLPWWQEMIAPELQAGRRVLIVAHGGILRALMKFLGNVSDEGFPGLRISNGIPFLYRLDGQLRPLFHRRLGFQRA